MDPAALLTSWVTHIPKRDGPSFTETTFETSDAGYALGQFLDDQQELLSTFVSNVSERPRTVDRIDGRMVLIYPELPDRIDLAEERELFVHRYGYPVGTVLRSRFRAVLGFLGTWQAAVRNSGIATGEAS